MLLLVAGGARLAIAITVDIAVVIVVVRWEVIIIVVAVVMRAASMLIGLPLSLSMQRLVGRRGHRVRSEERSRRATSCYGTRTSISTNTSTSGRICRSVPAVALQREEGNARDTTGGRVAARTVRSTAGIQREKEETLEVKNTRKATTISFSPLCGYCNVPVEGAESGLCFQPAAHRLAFETNIADRQQSSLRLCLGTKSHKPTTMKVKKEELDIGIDDTANVPVPRREMVCKM